MKSVLKYIIKRASYRLIIALFAVLIMYFDSAIQAASIPAIVQTGMTQYLAIGTSNEGSTGQTCSTSFDHWPNATERDSASTACLSTTMLTNFNRAFDGHAMALYASTADGTGGMARWRDQVTWSITNWTTVHTMSSTTNDEYTCPDPLYPTLNGVNCDSVPSCENAASVFSSVSSADTICVTDGASGLSCGYASVTDGFGANSGNFVPLGYACECADMPGGVCETGVEPPFPDGSDCAAFGTQTWCASDNSQCEASITESGGAIPCANCGVVNNTFMCAVGDAPQAERCQAGSGRTECEGVPDDWCPAGYTCPDLDQSNPDTSDTQQPDQLPCMPNDIRPSCQGVADGGLPVKSEETAQLEQANSLLKESNNIEKDGNKLLSSIAATNASIDKIVSEMNNKIPSETDLPTGKTSLETIENNAKTEFTGAISDSVSADSINTEGSGFFSSLTGTMSSKLIPTAACTDIVIDIPNYNVSAVLPLCAVADLIRPLLAWVFMIISLIYVKNSFVNAFKGQMG